MDLFRHYIDRMPSISESKMGLGRNTCYRVWAISEGKRPPKMGGFVFYKLDS